MFVALGAVKLKRLVSEDAVQFRGKWVGARKTTSVIPGGGKKKTEGNRQSPKSICGFQK